jgi:hypothetical protein
MLRVMEDVNYDVSSALSHINLYPLYTTNTFQAAVLPLLIVPLLARLRLPSPLLVRRV